MPVPRFVPVPIYKLPADCIAFFEFIMTGSNFSSNLLEEQHPASLANSKGILDLDLKDLIIKVAVNYVNFCSRHRLYYATDQSSATQNATRLTTEVVKTI
ncbi:hypothetical protein SERLA73DRAFT_182745 [Serpula lacrymans var. lacrymans S7.3]|uniref:Uncharacterized protein n=2 Tax=Serpula lacrymans var. lacrymans TaxID=341189 RepID=F8Q0W3_SERL3|nr:uncharacterized protein SERLADRAFT_469546 [Serpula lacrymans var. lacrymans S7.9]EGN97941.1 hypothetical protein SERLA73DRAFT_182745 [Serpula lacrymans var. lacrymans S7.3]EGO23529.1 hypothetical protein SERLADRAFT_469546 [Serpula lacrymans var. lacrymans S7.9]